MPKFLSVLTAVLALSACAALVFAQEVPPAEGKLAASTAASETTPDQGTPPDSTGEKPPGKHGAKSGDPAATPATLPSGETPPTPKPRRRSFFEWLFGSHRHKETPAPSATPIAASPTPSSHRFNRRPAGTPEPSANAKPSPTPKKIRGARPETTPQPDNPSGTPKPERVTPGASASPTATPRALRTPKPRNTPVPPGPSENTLPPQPPENADADAKEEYRFEVAKSKALEDPQVKALKDKADLATTDEESHVALRAYNKALFEKIKKIDPGVSEYAGQLENAIFKRLGQ